MSLPVMLLLSVPLAAGLLKWIPEKLGRMIVGVVIVVLGCLTLAKVISPLGTGV